MIQAGFIGGGWNAGGIQRAGGARGGDRSKGSQALPHPSGPSVPHPHSATGSAHPHSHPAPPLLPINLLPPSVRTPRGLS